MQEAIKRITGTWRLCRQSGVGPDGKRTYPFGKDAYGYVHFTESGLMAVQISRKGRGPARDIAHLRRDYLAYFGRYEVDAGRRVVRHFVEGQVLPGDHPDVLERRYRFHGPFMLLETLEAPKRKVLWQRV